MLKNISQLKEDEKKQKEKQKQKVKKNPEKEKYRKFIVCAKKFDRY